MATVDYGRFANMATAQMARWGDLMRFIRIDRSGYDPLTDTEVVTEVVYDGVPVVFLPLSASQYRNMGFTAAIENLQVANIGAKELPIQPVPGDYIEVPDGTRYLLRRGMTYNPVTTLRLHHTFVVERPGSP